MSIQEQLNNPSLNPFLIEGFVMDVADPMQMGRLKIWCPGIDGEHYDLDALPWAEYLSPFGGLTTDYPTGRNSKVSKGQVAYGFFALPKLNASVVVFHLNGQTSRRFYIGSFFNFQRNRSLPAGRNKFEEKETVGPFTDTGEPLEPAYSNLRSAFGDDLSNPIAKIHGAYEKQVAQAQTEKDGSEGYMPNMADASYNDSQQYCLVTPGHHVLTMSDHAAHCRIRLKSCEGNQVILDDTNGKIYVSTALGNSWVEINEDGHINVYGGKSISIRAQGDLNLQADKNINMAAGGDVNVISGSNTNFSSGGNININSGGGSTIISACANIDLNANGSSRIAAAGVVGITGDGGIVQTGSEIHLNGPSAPKPDCAGLAGKPSISPTHEPFTRPK